MVYSNCWAMPAATDIAAAAGNTCYVCALCCICTLASTHTVSML